MLGTRACTVHPGTPHGGGGHHALRWQYRAWLQCQCSRLAQDCTMGTPDLSCARGSPQGQQQGWPWLHASAKGPRGQTAFEPDWGTCLLWGHPL